jgi:hypothetical protein
VEFPSGDTVTAARHSRLKYFERNCSKSGGNPRTPSQLSTPGSAGTPFVLLRTLDVCLELFDCRDL